MGKDINSFHLLDDNICFGEDQLESREIDDELAIEISEEDIVASEALNSKQRHVYNSILGKVFSNEAATFFVDGPAGTGKTFLYKALLAVVRSRKLVALATASSGVAASILPGGRTAHSRFKIPLDTDEHSICCVSKQSAIAKLLRVARLIIWDEAPMSRKQHIQALDKMLRDINDSDLTFGGKVVVFGGDFRQVLPVVRKGTRQEHVDASLVSSYLWPTLIKFHLTENMRARLDPVFSEYVLELGNEMPPITVDETIKILDGMLVPYEDDCTSLDHLIDAVFHDIHEYSINISAMMNRFPIRLSFAMTINKSQWQTLDFAGIYLPQPVFSHGQLYVALSRAKTASTVRILIRPVSTERSEKNCTKNIVYTELLSFKDADGLYINKRYHSKYKRLENQNNCGKKVTQTNRPTLTSEVPKPNID
ncbi:hypothetical protein I3760_05G053100 [Carya illinoinensis]|nr:hypothetical protein I3760_05G053100 [Carya illinoinensis]